MKCVHMTCHQCSDPSPKYTFRGGYIEDESGDRWWSAELVARLEREIESRLAYEQELAAKIAEMASQVSQARREGAAEMRERAAQVFDAEDEPYRREVKAMLRALLLPGDE